jgi:predicted membrane chloride channel (bestrophin family)
MLGPDGSKSGERRNAICKKMAQSTFLCDTGDVLPQRNEETNDRASKWTGAQVLQSSMDELRSKTMTVFNNMRPSSETEEKDLQSRRKLGDYSETTAQTMDVSMNSSDISESSHHMSEADLERLNIIDSRTIGEAAEEDIEAGIVDHQSRPRQSYEASDFPGMDCSMNWMDMSTSSRYISEADLARMDNINTSSDSPQSNSSSDQKRVFFSDQVDEDLSDDNNESFNFEFGEEDGKDEESMGSGGSLDLNDLTNSSGNNLNYNGKSNDSMDLHRSYGSLDLKRKSNDLKRSSNGVGHHATIMGLHRSCGSLDLQRSKESSVLGGSHRRNSDQPLRVSFSSSLTQIDEIKTESKISSDNGNGDSVRMPKISPRRRSSARNARSLDRSSEHSFYLSEVDLANLNMLAGQHGTNRSTRSSVYISEVDLANLKLLNTESRPEPVAEPAPEATSPPPTRGLGRQLSSLRNFGLQREPSPRPGLGATDRQGGSTRRGLGLERQASSWPGLGPKQSSSRRGFGLQRQFSSRRGLGPERGLGFLGKQFSAKRDLTAVLLEEEHALLRKALMKNFMFKSLSDSIIEDLIQAFEKMDAEKDQVIVRQGDSCENACIYVIAEGECSVIVNGKVVPEPYGTLKAKSVFGEVGVMQSAPRAATISVKSDTAVLFRADGATFKSILGRGDDDDDENDPDRLKDLKDVEEINEAIHQLSGTKSLYGGSIIRQYRPNRGWLWSQWSGTVIQHNIKTALLMMLLSLAFVLASRACIEPTWEIGLAPDEDHLFIQRLAMIQKLWVYQMTLTTFVLAFYVNQAYAFWQDTHALARGIQGRLNNFLLILATCVARNHDGTVPPEGEALMDDVGSSSRLFHALFWASCAKRFKVLRTRKGLRRMADHGMMTLKQLECLESLDVPDDQRHVACLEWMIIRTWQSVDERTLKGGPEMMRNLMKEICELRTIYAKVGDNLCFRMPLAYTHFVQILVDTFIIIAPVALYATLGIYSVFCVGILTLFYTGLMDLAKIFLDPLDNESYTKNSINLGMDLGVLTRESNAGSTLWKKSGQRLPFEIKTISEC